MKAGRVSRVLSVGVLGWALLSQSAPAQDSNRPPSDVPEDSQSENGVLAIRIGRLEASLRRATGQIEELQNDNRKLGDQLRKFRDDVEFRLSGKSGEAPLPAPTTVAAAPEPTRPARKADAFDPAANPNAPGVPKQIGTSAPSAPLTLSSHVADEPPALKPLPLPTPEKLAKADEEPTFVPSGVPFSDSKEQFKAALTAYKAGQYSDAEALFKAYLTANKGAANSADAIFYIGETYMQRGRPREAAEQYLKVSTEYAKSPRAPESMLRLGLALVKLGNNEQACATFVEVGKRYPTASATVKKSADREIASHRCS